jgi:hypothetical protein
MMFPMAFDAPGSEKSILTWDLVLSVMSYPIFYVISVVFTLIDIRSGRFRMVWPMLVWVIWVFVAYLLVEVINGGSLSGV